jgi:glycosyltransferase involved in cell wall biosynthesis
MKIGMFSFRPNPGKVDRALISASGLFDAGWYAKGNPDIATAGIDPLDHYLASGASELRDPGPLFDASRYAQHHPYQPAVAKNPLLHYLKNGGTRARCLEQLRAEIAATGLFDAGWYLSTYPDVAEAGIDPLDHFICNGAGELRDPGPSFNASWYLKQVHDPRAATNPLLHFIRIGASINRRLVEIRHSNTLAIDLLSEIEHLDPDLPNLMQALGKGPLTVVDGVRRDEAADAWDKLFASLNRPYDRLIFVPWLMLRDEDLVAAYAARAAIDRHGIDSLLVVVTDSSSTEALGWLPAGTHVRILGDYGLDLSAQDRMELSLWLVQALRPRSLFNINSRACWEILRSHGAALSTFCELHAALFCRDFDESGHDSGYSSSYFRSSIPHLKSVLFDNQHFADELAEKYGVPPSLRMRLKRVYQPAPAATPHGFLLAQEGELKPVMWAGRLCRQQNLELLIEIAKRSSLFHFEVFGAGELPYAANVVNEAQQLTNLSLHGAYGSFSDLPTTRFSAFLYTALRAGLPNVLLAAAAAGLPIVAPAVGGIQELVDESTGWLVQDYLNPQAYLDALEDVGRSPQEALQRTVAMRKRLLERHSWTTYIKSLIEPPSFLS